MADGLSDIIISDPRTDLNQVRIPNVSNLAASWEISNAGLLSFSIPLRDLLPLGINRRYLLRKWVKYTHPSCGVWGGFVSNVSGADGIITVTCESWAGRFKGLMLDETDNVSTSMNLSIGAMLGRTKDKTGVYYTAPSDFEIDAPADPSIFSAGSDIFGSVLPALVERVGLVSDADLAPHGYHVDPVTRNLTIKKALGIRRNGISLNDGWHHASSGFSETHGDTFNSIALVAKYGWYNHQSYYLEPVTGTRDIPAVKRQCKGGKWVRDTRYINNKRCVGGTLIAGHPPIPGTAGTPGGWQGRQTETLTTVFVSDQSSVNVIGEQRLNIDESGKPAYPNQAAMQNAANSYLARYSKSPSLVTVEVPDVLIQDLGYGSAGLSIWSQIREGDTIPVRLSNSGMQGTMVVRVRALDVARGILIVSGEAELLPL